jgi:hypothetical protein
MRARGELYFEKVERAQLLDQIEALRAENELLKGGAPAEPSPPVALPPTPNNSLVASTAPSPPEPPQTCSAEESRRRMDAVNQPVAEHIRDTRPRGEAWRDYMNSAHYDRWSNRN